MLTAVAYSQGYEQSRELKKKSVKKIDVSKPRGALGVTLMHRSSSRPHGLPRRTDATHFFLIVRRTSPKWRDSLYSTNSRVLVSKDEGKVDE